MTPSSWQVLHSQWITDAGSGRSTTIRPGQERLPGRRRQRSALIQAVPPSPAVAARTMLLRCSARRRPGPGMSSGRSRKWCRSATNIRRTVSNRRGELYRPAVTKDRASSESGIAGWDYQRECHPMPSQPGPPAGGHAPPERRHSLSVDLKGEDDDWAGSLDVTGSSWTGSGAGRSPTVTAS